MTPEIQRGLIRDLCDNLTRTMLERAQRIPEDWDGYELRQLMADVAAEQFRIPMPRQRAKEYRNSRAIHNL